MGFQSQVNSILNQAIGGAMAKGVKDTSTEVENVTSEVGNVKTEVGNIKTATEEQTEQLKQIAKVPDFQADISPEKMKTILKLGKGFNDAAFKGKDKPFNDADYLESVTNRWGKQLAQLSPAEQEAAKKYYKDNLNKFKQKFKQKDYSKSVAKEALNQLSEGQEFQEYQKLSLKEREQLKAKYPGINLDRIKEIK